MQSIFKRCQHLREFYLKGCEPDYELKVKILNKFIKDGIQYGVDIPLIFKETNYTKERIISSLVILLDDLELYNCNLNTKSFKENSTIYLQILE